MRPDPLPPAAAARKISARILATRETPIKLASQSTQPIMEISGTIRQVLANKGSEVSATTPETLVFDALTLMGEKNIGALVVMEGGTVVGVFSERDYSRKVILQGKTSRTTTVGEILSRPLISITPDDSIEECMERMTLNRTRHLPVLDGARLVGLVSMGDVVNWIMHAQRHAIQQLTGYISGQYPA
jgi:CBS domain-containing protein